MKQTQENMNISNIFLYLVQLHSNREIMYIFLCDKNEHVLQHLHKYFS